MCCRRRPVIDATRQRSLACSMPRERMSRAMSANSLGALLDMAEPTTLERDEFAARWAKWQTAVSLLRATASMMMMLGFVHVILGALMAA